MKRDFTAAHWGIYEIDRTNGRSPELKAFAGDPDPSPIGLSMLDASRTRSRVARPAVRKSWLDHGIGRSVGGARVRGDRRPGVACREVIRVVVVGSSTGVGKTHVSLALLALLKRSGVSCAGLKPVESGLGTESSDRTRLAAAGTFHVKHWPYGYPDPVSPQTTTT